MKKWLLISVVLHLCLLVLVYWGTRRSHQWTKFGDVYQVDLVSLPEKAHPEEKAVEAKTPPEVQAEVPKPEVIESPVKIREEKKPEIKPESPKNEGKEAAEPQGPKVSVSGEAFPSNYYLDMLRKRIQENWKPPFQESGGAPMSAIVAFRIQKNGMIDQVELEKSTGRFMFDQAARRAVFDAGKMPPLPPEFTGGQITIHVEFETLWEKH